MGRVRSVMIYLERVDPARNMARFYRLAVQPTLFGEWALILEWGRIGSPGRAREIWYACEADAQAAHAATLAKRLRRGYLQR